MKKLLWLVGCLPLIWTALVLQWLPDEVPMHYDIAGQVDRWGSKYESLLVAGFILVFMLFCQGMTAHHERQAVRAVTEREQQAARTNAKILTVTGLCTVLVLTVVQGVLLYNAYTAAGSRSTESTVDMGKLLCLLLGGLFMVMGNFMPRTKRNSLLGIRLRWSRYNDNTWRKSNLIGGWAMAGAGLLMLLTALFTQGVVAIGLMLGYLLVVIGVTVVGAYRVYRQEITASSSTDGGKRR